jgi:glycosyltransferase involved in cell wall biosynthesis
MSMDRPLRIAMVGTKGIPATFGGIERHVEELGARLAERGHRVRVHCRRNYTGPSRDQCEVAGRSRWRHRGMELRLLPSIGTKHLDAISHTALAVAEEVFGDSDVVHFHALGPSLLSWLPRLSGRRVVATVHGLDWQRRKWGLFATAALRLGEWSISRFPHRTISVSKTLAEHFRRRRRCEALHIPNGITLPELRPAREITEDWGLAGGDYYLFLSRLVPEKRADLLIEAFRGFATERRLVIAGGSSMSDSHVDLLRQLAKGDPRIVFTGNVTGDLLAELMSNAYAFVLPSELEGLPIVLLEAMSFGRCVLASDIPMNMEVIEGGGESEAWGRSFRSNDVTSLRQELTWLEEHPSEVAALGEAARPRVVAGYGWEAITDQTETVYEELTRGR